MEEIPALIRPQASTKSASTEPAQPPPAALRRPMGARSDDTEEDLPPPVNVFSPPAVRDDVEPRTPVSVPDPLELPTLEPDEGDNFVEELPQE